MQQVHAGVARSTFRSEHANSTAGSEHFGSLDVEKEHAVVARSTFRSQNVQSTPHSEHFLDIATAFLVVRVMAPTSLQN